MRNVIVLIGPGQIGQAIARRVGVGKHVLFADMGGWIMLTPQPRFWATPDTR
jgi:hypothetical protein